MAKKKESSKAKVIFLRSIAGEEFSYRKGQETEIDAAWAEKLAEGKTVRLLRRREKAAAAAPERATSGPSEDETVSREMAKG